VPECVAGDARFAAGAGYHNDERATEPAGPDGATGTVRGKPMTSDAVTAGATPPATTEPDPAARDTVAFPRLTDAEIDVLRRWGREVTLRDREALWEPGATDYCFFVILSGGCVVAESADAKTPVAYHYPGEFSGDVDTMTGRPAPVGAYADGETRALVLEAEQVREVVRVAQDLGGKILLAFVRRREILLESTDHGILLVGSQFDPETVRIRQFLSRNRVVHRWRRPEDPETARILAGFDVRVGDTPMVFIGQERFSHPSLETLADRLGVRQRTDQKHYDLVIVGAGPAGLAAAVYGASEGLSTLVLDRSAPGGQAAWSSRIENYMGFPEGLTGADLAARGLIQAQKFGAAISVPADVVRIEGDRTGHTLYLESGEAVEARCVVVATGARYQKLPIPNFETFETKGIYYAATALEADFCNESEVVVVGAGNSAGQAAVFLSQTCKTVRLIVRGDRLNKSMSDYLSYRVEQIPNIEVHLETEVAELRGGDRVESAVLRGKTNAEVPCEGLFVFIGATPNTEFLRGCVALDRNGFVLTGDALTEEWGEARPPFYLETSEPGVFAAGDCRVGSVKRVASSVGEGSMAVTFVHRFLSL
jgi:thioredoxin reductase (NADPH)